MLAYDIKQVGPHTWTIHDKVTGEQVNIIDAMKMKSEEEPGRSGVRLESVTAPQGAADRDRLLPP